VIEFLILTSVLSIIYFMTLTYLQRSLAKVAVAKKEFNPDNIENISVIVCARNEEKNLPGLIEALAKQKTEGLKTEYILVDDRSEDTTGKLIDDAVKKHPSFRAIHITERKAGFAPKKRAIDTAIKQASGEIILLTDADGRPGPEWVMEMTGYFSGGADMVIGYAPYSSSANDKLIKKLLCLEYFSIAAIAAATAGAGFAVTCVGTNMGYRKKTYNEIGGFGEFKAYISGDDDLFLTRVRENGSYRIIYAASEKTHVINSAPKTFKQFFNQRLRYASKGFDYPLRTTTILAMYILYNLCIFTGAGLFLTGAGIYATTWLILIVAKAFFEYSFLAKAGSVLGDQRFIKFYAIAAVFHVPYVLFFGIFGQFKFFKWAEPKAEYAVLKQD